ncbi:hypothetical protein PENARI_c039G01968 [Penicillium arizonense]|uniref:Serine hydrolase domain-containing protein n=1 Tax=Penicillium arizonense TaxID=1835702 RepID=A0A1F5L394_PENAI|nr:hypothetical protein PENARI_c039G01968 [Penicillium arizonense]OGE47652.1 hypothetical protein PENARI_c039G01968 [Penicillium arizonense]
MASELHKILILHGHGQSAEIIKPKTRYVREVFRTLSDDIQFEFQFLSGVLPAYPDEDDNKDQKVWGHGEPEHDKIRGLEKSLEHIFNTLDEDGPFSGIIGFSSGAAMAAIVASLLEKRKTLCGIPWKARHLKLRFVICLSGFQLGNKCYEAFYYPKIATPTFHTFGTLDETVTPAQTAGLAKQCAYAYSFGFFGGHYVPQSKEYMSFRQSLERFLKKVLGMPAQVHESCAGIDVVGEKDKAQRAISSFSYVPHGVPTGIEVLAR